MFCKPCRNRIKQLIQKIDDTLLQNVDIALSVANVLKASLESGLAVKITDLIPGTFNDLLREKLLSILTIALRKVEILDANQQTVSMKDVADRKHVLDSRVQKVASLITRELDGRHQGHLYDLAVQTSFSMAKMS